MPCTQYGAHPEFHGRYEVLEAGDFPSRRRLNLGKGTIWVRTCAPSTAARRTAPSTRGWSWGDLHSLPWYAEHGGTMTRAEYDRLSEHGRELLARCHVLD